VRVNAVAPGLVETEMLNRFTGGGERKTNFLETVPVKRAATPEEIADTIVFLACKAPLSYRAVHFRRWREDCRVAVAILV
jgi:NAD(P)-dependent dehydrogenase (short-subunit alcohol dehydrogenase family)